MAGLYVHIPFCSSFCIYCDFYSELTKGRMDGYLEALSREAEARKDFLRVPPSTVYIGGGTPSLLSERQFMRLVDILKDSFGLFQVGEFTLEANPDDVTPEKLALWRSCGVNRLSMGVQSFCDEHLKWMRRRHSAECARKAYALAREAGFENISLDLIFGFAGLTDGQWDSNISEILRLEPEHVSCYQMMLEPGSDLSEMADAGRYAEPEQEVCAGQYAHLQRRLEEAGYRQYEVSNFARPGREARHNSAYWRREAYLGLGPAAHSFDGRSLRSWNDADLTVYLKAFSEPGSADKNGSSETLSDKDAFNETIMLSLRTAEGLDIESIKTTDSQLFAESSEAFSKAIADGDLINTGSHRLRIPADRFFISDAIIESLFA